MIEKEGKARMKESFLISSCNKISWVWLIHKDRREEDLFLI
ncbi:hypothetical protein BSM4216_1537 [Bacillus smithii]|nr:hypothetical protein BSM4216_1537 [Bacillus smithii]